MILGQKPVAKVRALGAGNTGRGQWTRSKPALAWRGFVQVSLRLDNRKQTEGRQEDVTLLLAASSEGIGEGNTNFGWGKKGMT